MTTHLSLDSAARRRSVMEIVSFAAERRKEAPRVAQVLLGDMNAEPIDLSMRFLQGLLPIEGHWSGFRDSWLDLFDEPRPRSNDPFARENGFTFPSDDPKKRIDLIFACDECLLSLRTERIALLGQNHSSQFLGKKDAKGMLSPNAPLW